MIMYINRVFHKYTFFGIWYCAMLIFSLGQYKMMLEKAFFAKMTPYLWTGATHVKCCIWLNWPYFCECLSAPNMVKWGMAVSSTFVNLLNSMINWSFDIYDLLIDDECLNNRVLHSSYHYDLFYRYFQNLLYPELRHNLHFLILSLQSAANRICPPRKVSASEISKHEEKKD